MSALAEKRFYVYAIALGCRVAYIGKGVGRRCRSHLGKNCKNALLRNAIAEAREARISVKVRILRSGLTEHEAFRLERALVVRHHERLTNVMYGNRSFWETFLAKIGENLRSLKSEDDIRREGDWKGTPVEARIGYNRLLRERLARLIAFASAHIGVA